jgi:hypothetical protein
VAARVEEMAAARNLRMEGGGCSTWGREKREDGGRVAAKGGKGGRLPTRGLKRGAARVLGGGGKWASHRRIVINGPKPFLRQSSRPPAHTSNIHFTVLRMFTS